jgi:hypothetical protein
MALRGFSARVLHRAGHAEAYQLMTTPFAASAACAPVNMVRAHCAAAAGG